jgi:hypothetical protein
MRLTKLALAAVGATIVLGVLAGPGAARSLSVSSQRMRASFSSLGLSGGWGSTSCEVVVEGSVHTRTSAKVADALVGYITGGSVGSCRIGGATLLRESFPWHVRYIGFSGTLPNITSVREKIIDSAFVIREPLFGIACLFRSTEREPLFATFSVSGGTLTSVSASGTITSSNCGITGTSSGTSNSLENGSGARITLTLI